MRRVVRLIGTWLVALGLIVALVDLTHSLEAGQVLITGFGAQWAALAPDSLAALDGFVNSRLLAPVLVPVAERLLGLPAALVLLAPGGLLAYLGRSRNRELYTRP
jgi:hypothetical protein